MSTFDRIVDGLGALPSWQQTALLFLSVLILGYFGIKIVERLVDGAMYRSKHIDPTLRNFLDSLTNVLGWVVLSVVLLTILGVDLAAALGGLAIGGFVIGFALKDTLGNLAAGVMLLFYRPYNVGDTVTIAGQDGDVVDLGISLTTLKAADGRIITIPNGNILGGTVVNHTRNDVRRADVLVGIDYNADIDTAVKVILEAIGQDARVLPTPAPSVRLTSLGDNAVGLQVRPWVKTGDFWQAKADFHGTVKRALDGAGIGIPFPQMDVHIKGES
ncbi:MAG: mechanosensitive ion channel family protein [Thermoplasmatota archaeon]